jgi:hypothetical protein
MIVPGGPAFKHSRQALKPGEGNAAETKIEQQDLITAIDPDGKSGERSMIIIMLFNAQVQYWSCTRVS